MSDHESWRSYNFCCSPTFIDWDLLDCALDFKEVQALIFQLNVDIPQDCPNLCQFIRIAGYEVQFFGCHLLCYLIAFGAGAIVLCFVEWLWWKKSWPELLSSALAAWFCTSLRIRILGQSWVNLPKLLRCIFRPTLKVICCFVSIRLPLSETDNVARLHLQASGYSWQSIWRKIMNWQMSSDIDREVSAPKWIRSAKPSMASFDQVVSMSRHWS